MLRLSGAAVLAAAVVGSVQRDVGLCVAELLHILGHGCVPRVSEQQLVCDSIVDVPMGRGGLLLLFGVAVQPGGHDE